MMMVKGGLGARDSALVGVSGSASVRETAGGVEDWASRWASVSVAGSEADWALGSAGGAWRERSPVDPGMTGGEAASGAAGSSETAASARGGESWASVPEAG